MSQAADNHIALGGIELISPLDPDSLVPETRASAKI